MLNPFPDLLVLSFFAPTLLRVAAAAAFLYAAYTLYQHGNKHGLVVALLFAVGAALLAGYYTQYAALAALVLLALELWQRTMRILPRSTLLLLVVICLSLLLTGAGALAFDLPL